ncbi:MAG TPA: hypothetical protein VFU37_22290 [Pyrinomonadaceae bacterium]|nr:hypothetical protein [Pyrinomonadaceae bacterium]
MRFFGAVVASLFLAAGASQVDAKSWRGIVPLKSTRNDVERKLGKPLRSNDQWLIYELANEDVSFRIADGEACGASASVAKGTLIYVEVMPRKPLHLSDLGLNPANIRKFESDIGPPFEGYVDEDNGLAVRTEINKLDVSVAYFLGIAKERERCPAFYPIARRLVEVPMCFLCPTISVSSPDEVEEGTVLIFTTNVRVDWSRPTVSKWRISAGKIFAGQGTDSIRVDTATLAGKSITATLEIEGLDRSCPNQASSTVRVIERRN